MEVWSVRIVAVLTTAMGAFNLVSATIPAFHNRLVLINHVFPLQVRQDSRLAAALAGFALFLLASSLWRRKRTAWLLTILVLVISIVTNLIKGLDYEEASSSAVLIMLLLVQRPYYYAASDRPSIRQGLIVLASAFGFTLAYGTIGLYLLERNSIAHLSVWSALQQTVVMFTSFYNPGVDPNSDFGRYFTASIYVVGAATLGYALLMLVRPVLVRRPATAEERKRATIIIEKYGSTARARAALLDDKSYFFSPGGSVIAYAARERGAMALGDPIGPPEDAAAAIKAFKEYCAKNDWQPAFMPVRPDYLEAYRAAGFVSVCIGNEAIVSLAKFTLEGSENRNVRNAISKFRHGYKVEVHQPPLDEKLLHELKKISDAWLAMKHSGELFFTNGWFEKDCIRNETVIVVHAPDGRPTAFANLIPEYQKNEATIDMMRRYPEAEEGTMDFLYVSMLEWAKEHGFETFSLGVSPFVGVGEQPEDPRSEQALHAVAGYINRFYNFKGIHFFKNKFHPQWEPRYMVYPGTASLPNVLSTLVRVQTRDKLFRPYN